MTATPANPDRRPLPQGWNEHYDASKRTWYYICTKYRPPRVSTIHPLGPPARPPHIEPPRFPTMSQDEDVDPLPPPYFPTPDTSASTRSPAQELYASASTSFQTSPTLPAPSIPFLTPPSSPHLGPSNLHHDPAPMHRISKPHQPGSPPRSHNHSLQSAHTYPASTPVLTTNAEAPKDYKPKKSGVRVHTTAPQPPHLQVQLHPTTAYPSPAISTSSTTPATSSIPVYSQEHLSSTPPQNQSAYPGTYYAGQPIQSAYKAPRPAFATPVPDAAAQTAAEQAMLIQQQQQELASLQQLALQQRMMLGMSMYSQQHQPPKRPQQNSLGNQLFTAFVRGAVGAAFGA